MAFFVIPARFQWGVTPPLLVNETAPRSPHMSETENAFCRCLIIQKRWRAMAWSKIDEYVCPVIRNTLREINGATPPRCASISFCPKDLLQSLYDVSCELIAFVTHTLIYPRKCGMKSERATDVSMLHVVRKCFSFIFFFAVNKYVTLLERGRSTQSTQAQSAPTSKWINTMLMKKG